MEVKSSRRRAREQAFILLFESIFNPESIEELCEEAQNSLDESFEPYAAALAGGAREKTEDVDAIFEPYLKGWSKTRISKASLTILRLAVYEMHFVEEIPQSVAINEAIELMKKYGAPKEASFVNGVLGSVARACECGETPSGAQQ